MTPLDPQYIYIYIHNDKLKTHVRITRAHFVLLANQDDVHGHSQEAIAWNILRTMPRMYLDTKDCDLEAATWPCLQDIPMIDIFPAKSSFA